MSSQASGSGGRGFCTACEKSGHYYHNCPVKICFSCHQPGHLKANCPMIICQNCGMPGHLKNKCPGIQCFKCNGYGHIQQDCLCAICKKDGHVEFECSITCCSLCRGNHKAIDCSLIKCDHCGRVGHHMSKCMGCWHCGSDRHSPGDCQRDCQRQRNKVPISSTVFGHTSKSTDVTCHGCGETGHKKPECPTEQGHNKSIFRNLKSMDVNKTSPKRHDLQGILVIDPSGRGYFLNTVQKEFHWFNQFGSHIYVAEVDENVDTYIDFDANERMNHLYYYTSTSEGKQKHKLRFQTGDLLRGRLDDIQSLRHEVSELFPNDEVEVYESGRESFLVDYDNGHIILGSEKHNLLDVINVTRVDITLKHRSWSLKFAQFKALMPCRCGLSKHGDELGENHTMDRSYCFVETARSYDDFIRMTIQEGTKTPLMDLIVDLKSQTKRSNSCATHSAIYRSKYLVTVEEASYHNSLLHETLERHSNILHFYGTEEFLEREYSVFGWYESTLLDVMKSGNMTPSKLNDWILDIVKGLIWLHKKGFHHGSIHPQNIVICEKKAMLHGLTKDGSTKQDLQALAALMYSCFSGVYPPNEQEQYIPSEEDCDNELRDRDFEAYDLVKGLLTSRIQLSDVLMHPKFWHTSKRLDFVRMTSDYLLKAHPQLIYDIEKLEYDIYVRFHADPSFMGLPKGFIAKSLHYGLGEFKGQKVCGILRCFRNAYSHVLDQGTKERYFQGDINKLDGCIRALYPRLIVKLYRKLQPLPIFKTLEGFKDFF